MRQFFLVAQALVRGNIAESSSCRPFRCGWLAQTKGADKTEDFSTNWAGADATRPLVNPGSRGSAATECSAQTELTSYFKMNDSSNQPPGPGDRQQQPRKRNFGHQGQ